MFAHIETIRQLFAGIEAGRIRASRSDIAALTQNSQNLQSRSHTEAASICTIRRDWACKSVRPARELAKVSSLALGIVRHVPKPFCTNRYSRIRTGDRDRRLRLQTSRAARKRQLTDEFGGRGRQHDGEFPLRGRE